jgi:hypothetical protein
MFQKRVSNKILLCLLLSFALNAIWENVQSVLYLTYQGGAITEHILLRAALVDTMFLFILLAIGQRRIAKSFRVWWIIIAGAIVAIGIERWALATGRWVYAATMPIVPLLSTGLTPTLQLAVTGYIVYVSIFKGT